MLRPWPAQDGGLVRIRAVGGEVSEEMLHSLAEVSATFGDGDLHLTKRANLQLRGLPLRDGLLAPEVEEALLRLVPSPTHELVRNVMVSPLTGVSGGRADLRPLARALDVALCADPVLASLPGRFLVVLDDGRGDLADRPLDLGVVAVSGEDVQLRAGSAWGPVVPIDAATSALLRLAHGFLDARGDGPGAAWHVDELAVPLLDGPRDPRTRASAGPTPYGRGEGYEHRAIPGGVLTPELLAGLPAGPVIVTPWHGLLALDR
ncbi:MAG: nitrite reductase [Nocardioidaceae bacterium]|nr:nitrite reductase [Nocardioidaceae bacterium]